MENNIGWWLAKRAFLMPEREAYVDGDGGERLTFAELNARANRTANAFRAAGIEKGERVALLLMNSPSSWSCSSRSPRSARWSCP